MLITDIIGIAGVACVIGAYFLLQLEKVRGDGVGYLLLNLVGACLLIVSLLATFNLASFIIELCWLAISLFGLGKLAWRRWARRAQDAP